MAERKHRSRSREGDRGDPESAASTPESTGSRPESTGSRPESTGSRPESTGSRPSRAREIQRKLREGAYEVDLDDLAERLLAAEPDLRHRS